MTGPRPRAEALLLDFDGVLCHHDPARSALVEERYALAPGTVFATMMEWARYLAAVTGHITRAEWLDGVAEALADKVGGTDRARALVRELDLYRGEIDPVVLAFVREVRAAGLPVAIVSNATAELADDLEAFGIAGDFDAVVNSSAIGVHKPTGEFFRIACQTVGVPPRHCLLVDDTDRNIRGARVAGLSAYRYEPPDDLRYIRAALAL
jgi:putative hydrolase of the HAD superfamily